LDAGQAFSTDELESWAKWVDINANTV